MDVDLATIVINNRGGATRSDYDRVANIGLRATGDRLKAMALIDGQITITRFDDCGPRRRGHQHGTADRQCAYKAARFRHEAPLMLSGINAFGYL